MEIKDKIIVWKDFSDSLGARYRTDGPFSGQEFLEELLEPKFDKAVEENYILDIDLDGLWGYPSSFVSGSFGKLSLKHGSEKLLKHIHFKSEQSALRLEKIIYEIKKPRKYDK
jgi:hypothetical protein